MKDRTQLDSKVKRAGYVIGLVIIGIGVLHFLPISIPYTIKVPGKIIHTKEWVLQRGSDGSVRSTLYDHRTGFIRDYSAVQIDRGDAIRFQLSPTIFVKNTINIGDTVGVFKSNAFLLRLSGLYRNLALAKASLYVNIAGEKQEVIIKAKEKLALAQVNLLNQNRIFSRQDSLYQSKLVSREDFEITKNIKRAYEIEQSIAVAHLQVVQSGAKPEQIQYIGFEIESIEKELEVLKERFKDFTLISPISGKIYPNISSDTLLTIGEPTGIVLMPVKINYFNDLDSAQQVTFELPKNDYAFGKIVRKEAVSRIINNKQVFLVYAELNNSDNRLPFGFIIPCSITLSSLKPLPYFFQMIKSILI